MKFLKSLVFHASALVAGSIFLGGTVGILALINYTIVHESHVGLGVLALIFAYALGRIVLCIERKDPI
jgi:hypothetical protein